MIPTHGRDHNPPTAKTGRLTTKWSPHAQWALASSYINLS